MPVSNNALVASVAGILFALSSVGGAQAATTTSAHKSAQVANLADDGAIMIGPKAQKTFKSNSKVNAATHKSAMAQGAKEIPAGTVIYKEAGKLYMVPGNEPGAQAFQDDFDISY
jgi:hypothetical protein